MINTFARTAYLPHFVASQHVRAEHVVGVVILTALIAGWFALAVLLGPR